MSFVRPELAEEVRTWRETSMGSVAVAVDARVLRVEALAVWQSVPGTRR